MRMTIDMTEFAAGRHFRNPGFAGTKIHDHTPEEFVAVVDLIANGSTSRILEVLNPSKRVYFRAPRGEVGEPYVVHAPGYAPFCRHLFVKNFTDAKMGVANITDHNAHLLRSAYCARREGELPVLTRWFLQEDLTKLGYRKDTQWLYIVLYSKEHLAEEGFHIIGDWGIVSINSSEGPVEAPMPPITMMRNALGTSEGGSGAPLDQDQYLASVKYWSENAVVL
jgi:hypothetical protein